MSLRVVPRFLIVVGALLIIGACFLFLSDSPRAEIERTANLPAVQPSAARELPLNTAVLLEGHLKAHEPLGPEGFVIYEKERFLRTETQGASKDKQQWQALSVPRPLVGVELKGAELPVCNRDYTIINPPQRWQSDVVPTSRDLLHSTTRLRGFKSGDALTVDGRIVSAAASAARCVEAKAIFGGGQQAYRDSVRQDVVVFKVVAAVFAVLGGLMLAAAGWLHSRFRSKRS